MGFRLVPNYVTSNDLERRHGPKGCVMSPNSVAFGAEYVKVLKIYRHFLQQKRKPNNLYSSFTDILQ